MAAKQVVLPISADASGSYAVVALEHARDIWRDEKLASVVIAADVARLAPGVQADAGITVALGLMDAGSIDALPVLEGAPGVPSGVITRSDIGRFLFAQYGSRSAERAAVAEPLTTAGSASPLPR